MPWTIDDVDQHKAGLTDAQKHEWVRIANGVLQDCLDDGGDTGTCEPRAIRVANSALNESVGEPEDLDTLEGKFVPLVEADPTANELVPVKLIGTGWGSSGYYGPNILERDGSRAFPAGTHMYWNHPTRTEARERPERDLRDLAAVLTEDAHWDPRGPHGPGLYSMARVRKAYQEDVRDLAADIGLSIRTKGRIQEGEVDGKKGKIVTEIHPNGSVDFVTRPGAGGRVWKLYEAAGRGPVEEPVEESDAEPDAEPDEENTMDEQEIQEMRDENERLLAQVSDLTEQLTRATTALRVASASQVAGGLLAESELPKPAHKRVMDLVLGSAEANEDGTLNESEFRTRVEEAIKDEQDYLAEVAGPQNRTNTAGKIWGLGESGSTEDTNTETLVEAFKGLGLTEDQARVAAQGR